MPNRMLRDWTKSEKIKQVSVHGERFFTRLIMKVDDYGCLYADATLLKADLFPFLLNTIREADLLRWMAECQKAGLIVLYEQDNKKYLQIQDFRQRLDKSRSKYPLPKSTDFREIVNGFPAETEYEVEAEKKKKLLGPGGPPPEGDDKEKRKKFIPPTQQEAEAYFLSTVGNPKKTGSWPEDKCKNQAGKFLDHYTANGWTQGGGKKIVDWKAAARLWIRNELEGKFSRVPVKDPTPAKPHPSLPAAPTLDKEAEEINYLYDRFLEGQCTIISIEVGHYNFLKRKGLAEFSDDARQLIRKEAQAYILEKGLDNSLLDPLMKKYGVLHLFRQLQLAEKPEVFTTKPNA
jgi:hypothetical protein